LHPAELTSVVSTTTARPQLFPESAELAMRSTELLSRRTFHHAEKRWTLLGIVRSDVVHKPTDGGAFTVRAGSATNDAWPPESTTSRAGPPTSLITIGSPQSTGPVSHATPAAANARAINESRQRRRMADNSRAAGAREAVGQTESPR
jgi:hypothetical protein